MPLNSVSHQRFLFRSYTPYSEQMRDPNDQKKGGLGLKNPDSGIRISLLKVARAGTAAPFYFGNYHAALNIAQTQVSARTLADVGRSGKDTVPEGKRAYIFEDAGFSTANNPCTELLWEIENHHGSNNPVLVSIGTSRRGEEEFVGENIKTIIKRGLHRLGNPEQDHEALKRHNDKGDCFYYRFNDEGGLKIEMDEWKPKKAGDDTIGKMRNRFTAWLQGGDVAKRFEECAAHLVRLRRDRMETRRWERFALGQYFVCQVKNCPKDRDNQWLDREDFESHLEREHIKRDYGGDLATTLDDCRRIWRYRQPPPPI